MKLTMDEIRLMNAIEQVTGVSPKDCIFDEKIISFLVRENEVGKAIGRNAVNVKLLQERLGKRIEIIGYQEKLEKMITKELGITIQSTTTKGKKLFITTTQNEKRKALSNGKFKRLKEFIERNFEKELVIS